jgi:predicted metal-binding membrane protein
VTIVEAIAERERSVLVAALIVIPLLCWAWIVPMARDMYGPMTGASAWMMTPVWDTRHLALLFAMWTVMMIGMMLPSAAPTLLIYAAVMRRSEDGHRAALRVYPMAAGYLTVWVAFSLAATVLQRLLSRTLALSSMMKLMSPAAGGALLVVAAVYQITPLKRACLTHCQSPAAFIAMQLSRGESSPFRLGLRHGMRCLGCCWTLMLLLFVGGVMNLAVIVALTVFVLLEKLLPGGWIGSWVSAVWFIVAAAWIATH